MLYSSYSSEHNPVNIKYSRAKGGRTLRLVVPVLMSFVCCSLGDFNASSFVPCVDGCALAKFNITSPSHVHKGPSSARIPCDCVGLTHSLLPELVPWCGASVSVLRSPFIRQCDFSGESSPRAVTVYVFLCCPGKEGELLQVFCFRFLRVVTDIGTCA